MSSSLRKLFTTVWSFLKGLLHSAREAQKPETHLVHLHSVKRRGREKAVALFQELLGHANVTIVPIERRKSGWFTLKVQATREEIAAVEGKLPETTNSSVEPEPVDVKQDFTSRRFLHES